MSIYSASVAADADDTTLANGTFSSSSSNGTLGNISGNPYHASFRFDGVAIASGSTINSATMDIVAASAQSTTTVNLNVGCENVADATAPTNATTFSNQLAAVATNAAWNGVGAWSSTVTYTTPDFATSVQGVVDLGGWASGQAIQVFISNNGSSTNARRTASMRDHANADPSIDIDYTAPGGDGPILDGRAFGAGRIIGGSTFV